jgi:predicted nucleic acid-binding protein
MICVLDASGATQILLRKPKAGMFQAAIDNSEAVFAPDLFVAELSNTLWKYCQTKIFSADEGHHYITEGIALIDSFIDSRTIWQEAFDEGIKHRHPVYDMLYAVTARRNSGTLVTNDGDLAKICKKLQIGVCY